MMHRLSISLLRPALIALMALAAGSPALGQITYTRQMKAIETEDNGRYYRMDEDEFQSILDDFGDFTFGFWFQLKTMPAAGTIGRVATFNRNAGFGGLASELSITIGSGGDLKLRLSQQDGTLTTAYTTTAGNNITLKNISVGDWHYIVLEQPGPQSVVEVYIDDVHVGSTSDFPSGAYLITGGGVQQFTLGGRTREGLIANTDGGVEEFVDAEGEVDALYHTFSSFDGEDQVRRDFHSEVYRIGPTAFSQLSDGSLSNTLFSSADIDTLRNAITFYTPLQSNLASESPGKVISSDLWTEEDGRGALFVDVTQDFEGLSYTAEVAVSPATAGKAVEEIVTPAGGIGNYADGETVSFKAPEFIYVDRNGNALPPAASSELPSDRDIQNHAVTRWRTLGYTVVGTTLSGTDRAVDLNITENLTFEWQFQKEVAIIVDSALPDGLDSPGSGDPSPAVQKHWVQEGTSQIASIDGAVPDPDNPVDVRYRIRGYELQNHPDTGEVDSGSYVRVQGPADGIANGTTPTDGYSYGFWLRPRPGQELDATLVTIASFGSETQILRLDADGFYELTLDANSGTPSRVVNRPYQTDRWNHWMFTYLPATGIKVYFNGNFVAEESASLGRGFSLGDFIGVVTDYDFDELCIYDRALSQNEIMEAMHLAQPDSHPTLTPKYRFSFDLAPDSNDSYRFDGDNLLNFFNRPKRARSDRFFVPVDFNDPQQVPEFVATKFTVIRWHWQKEYKIDNLTVNGLFDTALEATTGSGDLFDSAGEFWVKHGDSLQVGADQVAGGSSVNGFVGLPTGLFENLTLSTGGLGVVDTTSDLTDISTASQYQIEADFVDKPGRLIWNYGETIHVVEVPLGTAVDPAGGTILSPSVNLSSLGLSETSVAPYTISMLIGDNPNDATVGNVARWDSVARKLYPVRPGQFLMSWPKEDGSGDKSIRVIAGFPNDSYTWDDGSERTIAGTGGEFPATPNAHYRALYNPAVDAIADGEAPPLKLDADPLDRWFFDPTSGLAYSERITREGGVVTERSLAKTNINTQGGLEIVEDSRSVLVFSARPIAEEVATGDLLREELLVRVVESEQLGAATYQQSGLSTGDGYVGNFDDDDTMVAVSGGPDPNGSWTVDFWAKREGDSIPNFEDTVVGMGSVRTGDQHLSIGFRADIDGNEFQSNQFTVNLVGRPAFLVDEALTDSKWHHWAVTYDDTAGDENVSIYRDGVLVLSSDRSLPTNLTNDWSIGKAIYTTNAGQPFTGKVDNVRVWTAVAMDAAEIAALPFTATPTRVPDLNFTFDTQASGTNLPQIGSFAGNGVVSGSAAADPNSLLLVSEVDAATEVATKLSSRFDRAGFGTGFVIPTIANYNTSVYNRGAAVGEWGPIYPVNSSDAAGADAAGAGSDSPTTVWYDNLSMPDSLLHPNVDWPNVALEYGEVRFPQTGPHKDKRIHIASRIGSEGVDLNGDQQLIFDASRYTNLTIYSQPDRDAAGYNPNEEHALVAPSVRHLIGGATPTNNPPEAVFALRDDLNFTNAANFTSEPWVLVQYTDNETGEQEMMAWKVEKTRNTGVVEGANLETRPSLYPTLNYDKSDITSFLRPLPSQPASPTYDFHYPVFAGDSLGFPYPLGNVIGAVVPPETSVTELDSRRVFWKDHKGNPWVVSGREPIVSPDTTPEHEAQFNARLWYPLKAGFWFDLDDDGTNDVELGTSVPWLPENGIFYVGQGGTSTEPLPQQIRYEAFWKNDYPVLKAGETATFAGGEYKKDRPDSKGLPAIVGMAAAQVIFDTKNPSMAPVDTIVGARTNSHSARIIRPLDQLILDIDPAVDFPSELTPANGNILVQGTKWFFTDLSASLQNRIYYDIIQEKIVLCGLLNDRDIADPDLTRTPIALYVLEPNVLSASDLAALQDLDDAAGTPWDDRMSELYELSRNPTQLNLDSSGGADTTADDPTLYYPGLMPLINTDSSGNFLYETDPLTGLRSLDVNKKKAEPLMSVGAGAALVPKPDLFTYTEDDFESPLYVTVAENNHPDLGAAPVSLHVVRISPQRFRGGVKMILAPNAFDEKVTLRHTADFGGAIENMEFEWYTTEVDGEIPETTPDEDLAAWGGAAVANESMPSFDLVGLPSRLLSDQWVYARYRHMNEGGYQSSGVPLIGAGSEESAWEKPSAGGVGGAAPFQWAGANNSPQIQASGELRYIPALALGWVKRVLDRINPYEARINDFYNNESPATYTSMIQQAGARPQGPVALNSDKNVVENVGLIALYQTVLDRAYDLASAELADTNGIQQAILLASTRISDFYNLIGNEAYLDALDPTIGLGTGSVEFGKFAPAVWSFQNEESSLLNEELGLLRGSDFAKAWPVDNRLFWNFVKGEGEAAYANNYGISDVNLDGFINEFDAAELYPQGHGDAWGQYGSALRTHYRLLQTPFFRWLTRAEFYNLADNVLEVDYLDEQKFAETAASRARVGSAIVQQTYRAAYTADPDGQWQGYTDVDTDRAWGVKGWGKRAGQGAYFDWLAANSLLPEEAPDRSSGLPAENLEKLDRSTITAPGEIAAALNEIQVVLDDATLGITPVGIREDTVPFDIDPARLDRGSPYPFTATHFEQIYERAITALGNAVTAFDYANESDQRLRQVAINTQEYTEQAHDQDVAFRNQLKEMFGSPYEGTIGAGKLYPSGYEGPDLFLWPYVDADSPLDYFPGESQAFSDIVATSHSGVTSVDQGFITLYFMEEANKTLAGFFSTYLNRTFGDIDDGDPLSDAEIFTTGGDIESLFENFDLPLYYNRTYGLQAPPAWGNRAVTGRIQSQVNRMAGAQIELHIAVDDYQAYMRELQADIGALLDRQEILLENVDAANALLSAQKVVEAAFLVADIAKAVADTASSTAEGIRDTITDSLPTVLGVANDPSWGVRGPVTAAYVAASIGFDGVETGIEIAKTASDYAFSVVEGNFEIYDYVLGEREEFIAASLALQEDLNGESTLRYAIATAINKLEAEQQEFSRLIDQGTALLQKRQTANQRIAANVQRERYNDMTLRVSHNDALQKYRSSFEVSSRYAYLAAKAYAYETNLSDSHPANARGILTDIVAARLPGHVVDGEPQINGGGLAESLAKLRANYDALNGQLGFNNPQTETGKFSLRRELFRVKKPALDDVSPAAIKSEENWRQALDNRYVANLWNVPEFRTYCRTPWTEEEGPQPGLVIPFGSEIFEGTNFFGWPLGGGDQSYDASQFSTKIRSTGVWLEGYDGQALAVAPRVWLVPAGEDIMRIANGNSRDLRRWSVVDQAVPAPFQINQGDLGDDTYIPGISNLTEPFGAIRKFSRFRAYHDDGSDLLGIDDEELSWDNRLVGRSVWNTKWLLIIPGSTFSADAEGGLDKLIGTQNSPGIRDIRLLFKTYSASGN